MNAFVSMSADAPGDDRPRALARSDTLSVGRMLLLATGVALAFWIASPAAVEPREADFWRWLWWQVLFGVSLVGPLIVIPKARRGAPIGLTAHFWLMTGLGSWLFVPGMAWVRGAGEPPGSFATCLLYTQSLAALWLVVSILVTTPRALRALVTPGPWSERCGLWLAVAWSPLGAWLLVDLYREILP